jgi:type I restriction enzyme S subunit
MSGETPAVREALPIYTTEAPETERVPPGYRQTEAGVIPEDWEVVPIGEIAKFTSGALIKATALHRQSSEFPVPVFGGNGIAGYTSNAIALDPTVVVGRVGQKCGSVYHTDGPAWITDNALYPRHIYRHIELDFLALALEGARLNEVRNRNDLPLITQSIVHAVWITLPPDISEQRAIAAALSDVDALISALDRLIAKKRAIKTAAMQQLLTGKQRLPGFSGEWEVKRFAEIASPRRDRVDPRKTGSPGFCVELENVESGTGRLLGTTAKEDQSSLKAVFQAGDVLFGKLRPYLRKYWLADRPGICSTEIWALAANRRLATPEFLFQVVRVDQFIEAASTAYGTHMPRSDWNVVKNYELAVPSVEEQTAIAAVLSDMDAEIAALEARREKTWQVKQGMMQELLTGRTRLV